MTQRPDNEGRDGAIPAIDVPLGPPIEPPPTAWDLPRSAPPPGTDVVAVGADLEPGTLLAAYRIGLFPMPFKRRRIAWFSPDPRGILPLDALRVTRSLRRSVKRYDVRFNTRFRDVMVACADPRRAGAWITPAFIDAYERLHRLGWSHSIEVYEPGSDRLVGGLYGVRIDGFFAGESMFHTAVDASKVALVHLVDWLRSDNAVLLDIQWTTAHLESLGAVDISRADYLAQLGLALNTRSDGPSNGAADRDAVDTGTSDSATDDRGPIPP